MKSMFAWAGALVGALAGLGRVNSRSLHEPLAIHAPAVMPTSWYPSISGRELTSSDGIPAFPHRRSCLASRREARRHRNARRGGRR